MQGTWCDALFVQAVADCQNVAIHTENLMKILLGNFDRAILFSTASTNNNAETTPFKKFMTNLRKCSFTYLVFQRPQLNPKATETKCLVSHAIVEFPNSRHTYALRTYFLYIFYC